MRAKSEKLWNLFFRLIVFIFLIPSLTYWARRIIYRFLVQKVKKTYASRYLYDMVFQNLFLLFDDNSLLSVYNSCIKATFQVVICRTFYF